MPEAAAPAAESDIQIGTVRLREHLLNHAELLFRRALTTAPGDPTATRLLGVTLFKMGRVDEGVALLRTATEQDQVPPVAWSDLATALQRQGDAEGAAHAYARAAVQPDAGIPIDLGFSTERAIHEFKIVDYPYRSIVRYGAGRPPHRELDELIGSGRDTYRTFLSEMGQIHEDFAKIPLGGAYETKTPFWLNAWFPPLDGMALTQMLRGTNPDRFVEIGSGVSTKFAPCGRSIRSAHQADLDRPTAP